MPKKRPPDGDQTTLPGQLHLHQRARNVISPSGVIMWPKIPSRKTGRMVHCEGSLERDAAIHFETSPHIVRYGEQPITIHYPDGNRLRRYTPDFEVLLRSGESVYVEIKPERNLAKEEVRHKLACVTGYFTRSGKKFTILPDSVIRQQPRLANLHWLYKRSPRKPATFDAMACSLERNRHLFPMPFSAAKATLAGQGCDIVSFLLSGLVNCDLKEPLTASTLIHINTGGQHEQSYLAPEFGF
jgi:hypothetical protein